ncbi:(2Fe-2S)-binding protein [Streptomyces sp. P01-B04]|uniref:(2Fe-2S)-binding protein n=1 Tax=Streptomyces poriferorum TaxID=2798799 RepID=A0ABY9IIB1_9ACTN|nr:MULTISPECIES: (2Fe-2S)-binding protein [Streptomyces]MBW5252194.1 (2Fe-2S)-binding protein [Streptomyces poriferorum]MBW5260290.1 (2Fe-2S)-binding protein [Streptomyces poriferorum]MDP5316295.1 (2Fe-2S)-binding protein [Streptomyces sp. Alt4]WLQ54624.1 (2Fe-2S)-binding protein [Streptomyces sp. Alt2]
MDGNEEAGPGGFFALRTTPVPEGGHLALARLYAGEDAPLTGRIDTVAARLGTTERRVAASVAHLGLAARLWSTALGSAVLSAGVPALRAEDLHWDPRLPAPDDLWLDGRTVLPGSAAGIRDVVQYGHLVPLGEAVRRDTPVPLRLLWGNAGSALAGAVRQLMVWARTHGRPDAAARTRALAAELFDHPDLRGTGAPHGPAYRRSTCCLYYRVPGGGLCGDCVFDEAPRPGTSRSDPA